jgi:hypothetical protein
MFTADAPETPARADGCCVPEDLAREVRTGQGTDTDATPDALRAVLAHHLLQWVTQIQGAFGTLRANGHRMTRDEQTMMLDVGERATERMTGVLYGLVRGLTPEAVALALHEAQTIDLDVSRGAAAD